MMRGIVLGDDGKGRKRVGETCVFLMFTAVVFDRSLFVALA